MSERLLCSNLILPPGDRSQKVCTIVVYRVEAYIFNFCCTAKQREVQTCSPQLYTSKTAGLMRR